MLERPFRSGANRNASRRFCRKRLTALARGAMAVTTPPNWRTGFATKREGVAFVLDAFHTAFPDVQPWILLRRRTIFDPRRRRGNDRTGWRPPTGWRARRWWRAVSRRALSRRGSTTTDVTRIAPDVSQ